jgi:methylmalonyl-CoA epimerase
MTDARPPLPSARLHHIGIACRAIEGARRAWELALGAPAGPIVEVPEERVRIAFIRAGDPKIELLEPTGPESPIAKFLDSRGEGVHHLAFSVADIDAALAELGVAGVRLIDERPRERGGNRRIAFLHPKGMSGVLTELVQYATPAAEREGY